MCGSSFLEKIIRDKRAALPQLREKAGSFTGRTSPKRPFFASLDRRPHLGVIAEVKRSSPSKGVIRHDFDPVSTAVQYEQGGASAVSVLTDEKYFQGHIGYCAAIRDTIALPVLRKDFIIDTLQVEETAHVNADAMLLIAEALDEAQLADLYQAARELEIEPFVEMHSVRQLDKIMRLEPEAVGVNNRDLFTFTTDLGVTLELMKHIPREVLVVAESGISCRADAELLRGAGVRALLVGESLMRAEDAGGLIGELAL
jgi:indole-3-glycerol phosphate synthase